MSSNIIFNKTNHKSQKEIIDSYILENIKKKTKKDQNKIKNYIISHQSKVSINFKDKKNDSIKDLEYLYKNSIISLENLKKQTEKNIFFTKKYSENMNHDFIDNNKSIKNTLMKKKFLINPLLTFSIKQ